MNTPRIGDTVHYRSHGSPILPNGTQTYPALCRAAIITRWVEDDSPGTGPAVASLAILNPTGILFDEYCRYDRDGAHTTPNGNTHASYDGFTPGTWHHIH